MKRSTERILTTHVGSLPAPPGLEKGRPDYEERLCVAVREIVQRQIRTGIDIVNDGELSKQHWLAYLNDRLGGFEPRPATSEPALLMQGKDRQDFPDFYEEATRQGTLFYSSGYQGISPSSAPTRSVCTGPITYVGQKLVGRDIDNFKAALHGVQPEEAFLPVTAVASIEPYRLNEGYYPSEQAFLYALADALRVEYEAIANAGLLLQIDDAWTAALWDRLGLQMGMEAYKKRCMLRVEVLNHALARIPQEQIRYHICWGSWHGPHANDISMHDMVDVVLAVKAEAYLFEAANVRHEHEYHVWERVKLPPGKILIPGVVSHATNVVEHPELVSERITRFARLVGRENVIAGTDCGFGGRIHAELAWAKLAALVQGAQLATRALRYA
jgi:5-methyltetrahydropteroyltriglutamate--homocysteine methyltransferase